MKMIIVKEIKQQARGMNSHNLNTDLVEGTLEACSSSIHYSSRLCTYYACP